MSELKMTLAMEQRVDYLEDILADTLYKMTGVPIKNKAILTEILTAVEETLLSSGYSFCNPSVIESDFGKELCNLEDCHCQKCTLQNGHHQ